MDVPTFFSDKKDILTYDYNKINQLVDSDINHYEFIENLSVYDPDKTLCKHYFQSIMFGQNHDIKSINLFTMGPGSYKQDELLGLYVDVIPRKSKL